MNNDEYYMRIALERAQTAYALGEVPVGAVLVRNHEVIASAHNLVENRHDPTAHAELLCLQMATAKLQNWRLLGATLYCTLEPCAMCAGALFLSRIDTLVWGAPDLRHGACGSWCNLWDRPHPIHPVQIRKGVLAEESGSLMKKFFQERRLIQKDALKN